MIGIIFFGIILLYLVFGFFLYGYIRGWGPGRRKALIITLVLMIGVPFGDVIPGKLYLAYVCQKEGGIRINSRANVSGYFALDDYSFGCGGGCIQMLRSWNEDGKPMFIEVFVEYPKEHNFVDKPGYYRFELIKRTSEFCALHDALARKYSIRFSHYVVPDGYCVSSKRISEISAQYSVEARARDRHVSDLFGVVADHSYIREIASGEVIASATRVTHLGGWLRRSISKAIAVGKPAQCPQDMTYALGSRLMEMVFE